MLPPTATVAQTRLKPGLDTGVDLGVRAVASVHGAPGRAGFPPAITHVRARGPRSQVGMFP